MALSVIPATIDLTIYQGTSYVKEFIWMAGDPQEPVDLTGCTARMQARTSFRSEEVYLDLTTENGGIELGLVPGGIKISVDPEQSSPIEVLSLVYDIEIYFLGGQVERPVKGKITLDPEVTKS